MKAGKTTSEFWAGLLVTLVIAINAVLPEASRLMEISDETAASIVGGIWSIYTVGRSWVKAKAA